MNLNGANIDSGNREGKLLMPVVLSFFVPPHAEPHDSSYNRWAEASTYFHRRVIHMIVFRGHRGGSVAPATLSPPEASPRRVSGHPPSAAAAPLLRRTGRQAAVTPAGGREKRPSGRPCRPLRSPRAALVMRWHHGGPRSGPEKPARPSDVSPFYESRYSSPGSNASPESDRGGR